MMSNYSQLWTPAELLKCHVASSMASTLMASKSLVYIVYIDGHINGNVNFWIFLSNF